jgi:hypothetical protein
MNISILANQSSQTTQDLQALGVTRVIKDCPEYHDYMKLMVSYINSRIAPETPEWHATQAKLSKAHERMIIASHRLNQPSKR